MEIKLLEDADEDLAFWIKSGNKSVQKKINVLLLSIKETPYSGSGNLKRLNTDFPAWSRRINHKYRLVYEIDEEANLIFNPSLKGHY